MRTSAGSIEAMALRLGLSPVTVRKLLLGEPVQQLTIAQVRLRVPALLRRAASEIESVGSAKPVGKLPIS